MNNKIIRNSNLKNIIIQNELFDLYCNLLNKHQIKYFKLYYEQNLTYDEIAEKFNITRAAAWDSINKTKFLLKKYESKLNLLSLKQKRLALYKKISNQKIKNKLIELENSKGVIC